MNRILWRHWPALISCVLILLAGGLLLRVTLALFAGLQRVEDPARGQLFVVVYETFNEGPSSKLPLVYGDRLRRVPGIANVVAESWAFGRERNPLKLVMVRALDLGELGVLGRHFEAEMPAINGILARGNRAESNGRVSAEIDGNRRFNAVFGKTLAHTLGLEKSDEGVLALAGGGEFKYVVIDIVDAKGTFDDTCMFVEREALWAAGRSRQDCTMFRAQMQPGASQASVSAMIEQSFQNFTPTASVVPESAQITVQIRAVRELTIFSMLMSLLTLAVAIAVVALIVFARLIGQRRQIALLQLIGFSRGRLISAGVIGGTIIGLIAGFGTVLVARFLVGDMLHGISGYDMFVPLVWTISDDVVVVMCAAIAGAFAIWQPMRWAVQRGKADLATL